LDVRPESIHPLQVYRCSTLIIAVSGQINVNNITKSSYCDFCVWTPLELFIERITPDSNFEKHVMKATTFFKYGVLPELLGKWFTRNSVLNLGTLLLFLISPLPWEWP